MAARRIVPRNYCAEPHLFGKADIVRWIEVPDGERFALRAAQLQHQFAVRIRDAIRAEGRNLKGYASSVGCDYDRMSKILRGALPMRLDDVAAADIELGSISQLSRHANDAS